MENILRKDQLEGSTDSKGGYLVEDRLLKLRELFVDYGLARKLVPVITVRNTDTVNIPVGSRSGVTAYVVAQAGTITASQGSFSQISINLKKIKVKVPITVELLADATEDLAEVIARQMAWAIAYKEDYEVFRGDGTDFTGFITHGSITTLDVDGAYLTPDHISKGIAVIEGNGGRRNDMYLVVKPSTLHYLRTLKDDNNNYLFTTYTANNPILEKGAVGEIMGVRVYVTDVFSSAEESTGSGTVTCTDALLFEKRAGQIVIREELYREKDKNYDTDVVNMYLTERFGFAVVHPELVYHFDQVKDE